MERQEKKKKRKEKTSFITVVLHEEYITKATGFSLRVLKLLLSSLCSMPFQTLRHPALLKRSDSKIPLHMIHQHPLWAVYGRRKVTPKMLQKGLIFHL